MGNELSSIGRRTAKNEITQFENQHVHNLTQNENNCNNTTKALENEECTHQLQASPNVVATAISDDIKSLPNNDDTIRAVLQKIQSNKNFKSLHGKPDVMRAFAYCLSDSERLKETYLNTDWAVNDLWRRNRRSHKRQQRNSILKQMLFYSGEDNVNQTEQIIEDSTSEQTVDQSVTRQAASTLNNLKKAITIGTSKSESHSKASANDLNFDDSSSDDESYDADYDDEMKDMWLSENPKLDKNLKVKLIITDMNADNHVKQNLRSAVSPVLSRLKFLPKYGIFHTCLVVGPFKLEWTDSALCVPRVIKSKASLLALDIKEIATVGEFHSTVDILADVITRWNRTMGYTESLSTSKKGNCQDFVADLLEALNIELELTGPVKAFFSEMKKHGRCKMKFSMSDVTFRDHFGIQEQSITFKSHEQLDAFVTKMIATDPNFGKCTYVQEYQLLKGFDRALWMRHLEQLSREESKQDPHAHLFKPLTEPEKMIDLETFEEIQKERCICPFEDPRNTVSFMDRNQDGK